MAFDKKTSNKTIILCLHCGSQFTQLTNGLCSSCKTPEKRAKMDAENTEIFKENGMKFNCEYCRVEKIRENNRVK